MTPTREQIEAAAIERCARRMDNFFENAHMNRAAAAAIRALNEARPIYPGDWKDSEMKHAQSPSPPLTAAAQVEIMPQMIAQQNARLEAQRIKEDRATTIERCAQVGDDYKPHKVTMQRMAKLREEISQIEAATIERCAHAISQHSTMTDRSKTQAIAAIRALKD